MSKAKSIFPKLKKNTRVLDTWYGYGVVIEKLQTRVKIKLWQDNKVWTYDKAHIDRFVVLDTTRHIKIRGGV